MSEGKRKRNIRNLIIIIVGIFSVSFCVAAYFATVYKINPSKVFDDEPIPADHMNKSNAHHETSNNRELIVAYDDNGGYGFRVRHGHISKVSPNSTAARAGVEVGDEIISVNDVYDTSDKEMYSHCHYFKSFACELLGYSAVECYIENGWASGNATVNLVVRTNLAVYQQLVHANQRGVAQGVGSFCIVLALPMVAYAFFGVVHMFCFMHTVPRDQRRIDFFHISLRPLKVIYSSHPILEREFWDNVNRVLDEHDVWEEDDEVVEESSES